MDGAVPALLVVGGGALVALIVVLIVVSVRRERERQRQIRQWAARRGWTVTARPTVEWEQRLPGYRRRDVSLLVSGPIYGWFVGVAEYSYITTSTDSRGSETSTTHRLIVTVIRLNRPYPRIAVEPRGPLSRLGRSMFGDNPAATGHDQFDRRFRVRTRNPALARTLLGPALIAEHLAGRVPEWSLADHHLMTWRDGWIRRPDEIPRLAEPLVRVASLLGA